MSNAAGIILALASKRSSVNFVVETKLSALGSVTSESSHRSYMRWLLMRSNIDSIYYVPYTIYGSNKVIAKLASYNIRASLH